MALFAERGYGKHHRRRTSPRAPASPSARSSTTSRTSARCCSPGSEQFEKHRRRGRARPEGARRSRPSLAPSRRREPILQARRPSRARSTRHRRARRAAGARAHQADVARRGRHRGTAGARHLRARREPCGRGGPRRLQGRLRALGHREEAGRSRRHVRAAVDALKAATSETTTAPRSRKEPLPRAAARSAAVRARRGG